MRIPSFSSSLKMSILSGLLLSSFLQSACNFKEEKDNEDTTDSGTDTDAGTDGGTGTGTDASKISFAQVESQIIKPSCVACHSASSPSGGVVLDSFAKVKAELAAIKKTVIDEKTMPQGGSLSASKIQLLKTWIEQGAPETP